MSGRRPKLSYIGLRKVDGWFAHRRWSATVMARVLKISPTTLYDAALRRRAYAGCP